MNRINAIIETVQKAVAGNFRYRIETSHKNDELDKLANAINQLVELMSEQITEKMQTDTALRDSEEKCRRLQANIPGMVYLFAMHPDGSFSFPYVNDASKKLFDIFPEDLMRDATLIIKLIHPDDRERFDTSIKQSAETLQPFRELLRHIVSGEVRWYDCISRPELQENGDILWDGIILEITDRRRIEEALRENEATLRSIYETSPMLMGVVELTEDDKIFHIYDNPATARFFNVEYKGTQNKAADELGAPSEVISEWLLGYRQSQKQGKPVRFEYIHPTPDGPLWLSATVSIIGTGYNGRPRFSYVAEDITERKRAEDELRKRDILLNNIFDQNPYPIWISDEKGTLVRINQACCDLLNIREDEVINKYNVLEDDIIIDQGYLPVVKSVFSEGKTVNFTVEYDSTRLMQLKLDRRANLILDVTISPVMDDSGAITNAVIMHNDITERRRVEEVIHHSEKQFRTLFMSMSDGFYLSEILFDDNGNPCDYRYVEVNPKFEQILGLSRYQIIGKRYKELVPVDTTRWLDVYCSVARTGTPQTYEFYSNEYQMYFETYSYQPTKGQVSVIVRNITERKRAEIALQQAKDYAEKLVESANAMIVVLDAEGKIQVFNKAAEEITGYSRQDLLGCDWFEVLVPKDKYPNVWDDFQKSARDGLPISFENPILTKAGEERFISWQNTGLLENGAFRGSISYGIDITERKRLEKQLLQSQKMEAIGQLTGGIAHDFNNMLSVILGHVELVKSSLPLGDPLLKSVLEIENAGLHSRDITRQLLAFSRKQIIAPKTTNLNKLIVNIKMTLAKLIGENIDLRFFPQIDLWNVRFDPTQIDQILINLAVNARDAMPDGGALTIETSNVDLDEVYCTLHTECRPGHYVLLSVTDEGVGMDEEALSHAFEPFYTTKEVGKGTGLGLATVYGIVKQNGGFINIYSEPGKGSTFRIHIPRLMDEVEKEKVAQEAPPEFHLATVLLVEDDDMVRRMTAAILKKIGYSVLIAETPNEALAMFKKEDTPINLLITDVVMPQMSGAELVAEISLIKPEIKVLFMSGYTENVIVHQGVLKKGIHFVQKPFSMNEFAKKVREALESK